MDCSWNPSVCVQGVFSRIQCEIHALSGQLPNFALNFNVNFCGIWVLARYSFVIWHKNTAVQRSPCFPLPFRISGSGLQVVFLLFRTHFLPTSRINFFLYMSTLFGYGGVPDGGRILRQVAKVCPEGFNQGQNAQNSAQSTHSKSIDLLFGQIRAFLGWPQPTSLRVCPKVVTVPKPFFRIYREQ